MINYDMTKILPHKPPMILIDNIVKVEIENQMLIASFKIYPEKLFFDKTHNGINSLVGLEFMAQTIGCYAYFKSKCKKSELGLLLGTRLYNNAIDYFKNGETYTVKVHEIFTNNEIVVFDCLIYDKNEKEIASASINAYQSDNVEGLLKNVK